MSILDADKEGFLRSTRSLIQTIGRAARNVSGEVHMYADNITDSMRAAIEETERRRAKQIAYNEKHHIDPTPLRKKIADVTDMLAREDIDTESLLEGGYRQERSGKPIGHARASDDVLRHARDTRERLGLQAEAELAQLIDDLSAQMHAAAGDLQFELAARLRDEVADLKRELRQMKEAN